MSVTIKVNINSSKQIIKDHGLDDDGVITAFARDEVYRLYEPYTPRDTGTLYREVTYPNNHSIKHTSPYSHYHYVGKKAVDPKYGVGAFYSKKTGRYWSRKGVLKTITDIDLQYQGAPERGANWDKRMMNDRGDEVCASIENRIKNGG